MEHGFARRVTYLDWSVNRLVKLESRQVTWVNMQDWSESMPGRWENSLQPARQLLCEGARMAEGRSISGERKTALESRSCIVSCADVNRMQHSPGAFAI